MFVEISLFKDAGTSKHFFTYKVETGESRVGQRQERKREADEGSRR
jgi:hypothetical protein